MKHAQSTHPSKPAAVSKAHGRSRSAAKGAASVSPNGNNGVDRDEAIRLAAYAFYEARGCTDGHALDDWLKAQAAIDQSMDLN
jgi:hypothetical protein